MKKFVAVLTITASLTLPLAVTAQDLTIKRSPFPSSPLTGDRYDVCSWGSCESFSVKKDPFPSSLTGERYRVCQGLSCGDVTIKRDPFTGTEKWHFGSGW